MGRHHRQRRHIGARSLLISDLIIHPQTVASSDPTRVKASPVSQGGSIALVDPSPLSVVHEVWMCPLEERTAVHNNSVVDGQVEVEVEVQVRAKVVQDPGASRRDDLLGEVALFRRPAIRHIAVETKNLSRNVQPSKRYTRARNPQVYETEQTPMESFFSLLTELILAAPPDDLQGGVAMFRRPAIRHITVETKNLSRNVERSKRCSRARNPQVYEAE